MNDVTMNRPHWFKKISSFSDNQSFYDAGRYYSYCEMTSTILQYKEWLESKGVDEGDAIIFNDDFSFASICMLFAMAINKNIIIPIVNITENGLLAINENLQPKYIIKATSELTISLCDQIETQGNLNGDVEKLRDSKTSGLVLLSSGSTGKPKIILHDFDNLLNSKVNNRSSRKLKTILFLLFDHIGGLNTALNIFISGGIAVNPNERSPQGIAKTIEQEKVSVLPTSPTFLNLILLGDFHKKYNLSSVRLITYGTEAMPASLLKKIREAFPKAKLLQTFGTSETGISKTVSKSSNSTAFKFSDNSMEYKVVDGELYLRSSIQFLGYLNHSSEAVDADGWFKTGDMVEELDGDYLQVVGRKKEVINVGGEKVLPMELESILHQCAFIKDCVVYGQPNVITGQTVCVDVHLNSEMKRSNVRKLINEYLTDNVEAFKIPTRVNIVDQVGFTERFKKIRIKNA